jgi:hypothetical protein
MSVEAREKRLQILPRPPVDKFEASGNDEFPIAHWTHLYGVL